MTPFPIYKIENVASPSSIKRASHVHEIVGMFQSLHLLKQYCGLVKEKQGNGERILLLPGWLSHEKVMFPVKKYLTKLGYAPEYWGLGMNIGDVKAARDKIVKRLKKENSTEKITLIGWSLGGLIAREIARELPDRIASVLTYGTPVIGGPKYTIGAKYYGETESERIATLFEELDEYHPITVPMTIIFTKKDSFVAWKACLDYKSEHVKHFEVNSTHLSLGLDPDVWKIMAWHLQNVGRK